MKDTLGSRAGSLEGQSLCDEEKEKKIVWREELLCREMKE